MQVTLLLGSNMGERETLIIKALELIDRKIGKIFRLSALYETEAWGFQAETDFFNCAAMIHTRQTPEDVLTHCQDIETALGRKRKTGQTGYQSRPIDIDILFYGNKVIRSDSLTVPHPKIPERKFALSALEEIMPDYTHPVMHKSISDLYYGCKDGLEVKKVKNILFKTNK